MVLISIFISIYCIAQNRMLVHKYLRANIGPVRILLLYTGRSFLQLFSFRIFITFSFYVYAYERTKYIKNNIYTAIDERYLYEYVNTIQHAVVKCYEFPNFRW